MAAACTDSHDKKFVSDGVPELVLRLVTPTWYGYFSVDSLKGTYGVYGGMNGFWVLCLPFSGSCALSLSLGSLVRARFNNLRFFSVGHPTAGRSRRVLCVKGVFPLWQHRSAHAQTEATDTIPR